MKKILTAILCAVMLMTCALPVFAADCAAGIVPGDANNSGDVDFKDVSRILRYCAGWNPEINLTNADVRKDGGVDFRDVSLLIKALGGWTNVRLGHFDNTEVITAATCTDNGQSRLVCAHCQNSVYVVTAALGHKYKEGACINCGDIEETYESYYTMVDWIKEKGYINEAGDYAFIADQNLDYYGYGQVTLFNLRVNEDDSTVMTLTYAYQPDNQSYYEGSLHITPAEKDEHTFILNYYYVDGANIIYQYTKGYLDNSKNAHFSEGYWGYSDSNMTSNTNEGGLSSSQLSNLETMTNGYMAKMFLEAEFELIGSNASLRDFGFIMD